jgi:hypothetical protein
MSTIEDDTACYSEGACYICIQQINYYYITKSYNRFYYQVEADNQDILSTFCWI